MQSSNWASNHRFSSCIMFDIVYIKFPRSFCVFRLVIISRTLWALLMFFYFSFYSTPFFEREIHISLLQARCKLPEGAVLPIFYTPRKPSENSTRFPSTREECLDWLSPKKQGTYVQKAKRFSETIRTPAHFLKKKPPARFDRSISSSGINNGHLESSQNYN